MTFINLDNFWHKGLLFKFQRNGNPFTASMLMKIFYIHENKELY